MGFGTQGLGFGDWGLGCGEMESRIVFADYMGNTKPPIPANYQ